jgi:UDP-glucose 4-epimerase
MDNLSHVVVTGGAGFIGSNIARKLIQRGDEVSVVDNMHTGSPGNLGGVGIKKLYKENVGNIGKLGMGDVDYIFHEGIYSSSPMYREDKRLTGKAVSEFIELMEFARAKDIGVTFASTSSIYNGFKPPHREDMLPLVRDFYTEARYPMERIGKLYSDIYGIKVIALRYFSVYGPHEKAKGEYANLITQFMLGMAKGKRPVIYGDGSQRRDFINVDDVVKANIMSMEKRNLNYGFFNVGTGKSYSLNEMAGMLNKSMRKSIAPRYVENKAFNYIHETLADASLCKEKLGFEAKISLETGIKNLVSFYGY